MHSCLQILLRGYLGLWENLPYFLLHFMKRFFEIFLRDTWSDPPFPLSHLCTSVGVLAVLSKFWVTDTWCLTGSLSVLVFFLLRLGYLGLIFSASADVKLPIISFWPAVTLTKTWIKSTKKLINLNRQHGLNIGQHL